MKYWKKVENSKIWRKLRQVNEENAFIYPEKVYHIISQKQLLWKIQIQKQSRKSICGKICFKQSNNYFFLFEVAGKVLQGSCANWEGFTNSWNLLMYRKIFNVSLDTNHNAVALLQNRSPSQLLSTKSS